MLDALGGSKTARARNSTATGPASAISMDLTESDWQLFLSGAKQMRFVKVGVQPSQLSSPPPIALARGEPMCAC